MTTPPEVHFDAFSLDDSAYNYRGSLWYAKTLIKACEDQDCEIFKLPLAGIDLGARPWVNVASIDNFTYHMKRCMATNLEYPVILDDRGFICDGWHRVAKAIVEGRRTVDALRLKYMPEPDEIDESYQE